MDAIDIKNLTHVNQLFEIFGKNKSLLKEAAGIFPFRNVVNVSSSLFNLVKNPVKTTIDTGNVKSGLDSLVQHGEIAGRTLVGETFDFMATVSGSVLEKGASRNHAHKEGNKVKQFASKARNTFESLRDWALPDRNNNDLKYKS